MKKIFYILILFSFFAKGQTPMFKIGNYTVTDYDLHYAVSVNMSSFISSNVYYVTKRPLLSGLIGAVVSFGVGYGKEILMDKNVSRNDLDADGRGSIVGGLFTFGITDTMKKRQAKLDTLKYQFRTL
jgi:hypothetical protein